MVAPTAHTTQQDFVIGQFQTKNRSHWSRHLTHFYNNKSGEMGNNLAEQQVNNNNKAKAKLQTQEQLSSPLSQVLKTYDFGIFEKNCELNTDITNPCLHSPMCCVCRNLHRRDF